MLSLFPMFLKNVTLVELVSGAYFMLHPSLKNTGALGFQSIKIFRELQKIACPDYFCELLFTYIIIFLSTVLYRNIESPYLSVYSVLSHLDVRRFNARIALYPVLSHSHPQPT